MTLKNTHTPQVTRIIHNDCVIREETEGYAAELVQHHITQDRGLSLSLHVSLLSALEVIN